MISYRSGVLSGLATSLFLCIGCAAKQVGAQGSTNGCRPADSVDVPRRLDHFRTLVSSTEPDRERVREALGIVAANASEVNLVTSRPTCVKLIKAVNSTRNEPDADRLVWAFTLGGGDYAVEDPMIVRGGEWMPVYIFDRKFKFKSILYAW